MPEKRARELIAGAIRAAVAKERDRCASIVLEMGDRWLGRAEKIAKSLENGDTVAGRAAYHFSTFAAAAIRKTPD